LSALFTNAHVVTTDDAGTEHEGGWLLVDDGVVTAIGAGPKPEADEVHDLRGAVVTPGLVNTHHHLWQNLTRARAQDENLFGWLKALYLVWSAIDPEAEHTAARAGLAELALSGCTAVFDHHYLFPQGGNDLLRAEIQAAREIRVRIVASRGSMDLGESQGGLPPDDVVEDRDEALAATEEAAGLADGAMVQIAVAPCSPFSVTRELMAESAALARRLRLRLHTHLAETVEEEDYCRDPHGGAAVLGRDDIGELSPGKRADFAVWRTDGLEVGGADDLVAGLVFSGPHRVDRLFVGGEEVVRDGRLLRADEDELAQDQRRQAQRFAA
jgi:cytosine/adenosine deaminase-related metal-dependent hydrolase